MLKSIKDYTATVVNSIEMLTLRVYHQNSLLSHFNHRGHCVDFKLFSCPSRFSTLASKSKENSSITESKVVLVALMLENEFLLFNTSNNTFYSLSAQVSDCDIQNQIYLIKNQDLIKFDFELKNPKLVAKNVEKIWIQNEIFVKSKSKILQIDQSGTLLREIKAPCKELQQVKKYLFTNSDDRFVSIYDLSHKVDGQDTTTKVRTFGLDAVPVRMSCNEKYVCVLDQDGKINIIDHHTNQKSIIELNCGDHVFLDCLLDNHNVIVVYGTVFNPTMERVDILDKNGDLRSHYVLTRIIKEASKSEKVMSVKCRR